VWECGLRGPERCCAAARSPYCLQDRGRIVADVAADICVIGQGGMTKRATYDDPRALASGVPGDGEGRHREDGQPPSGRLIS
jgi:hypothetical protein